MILQPVNPVMIVPQTTQNFKYTFSHGAGIHQLTNPIGNTDDLALYFYEVYNEPHAISLCSLFPSIVHPLQYILPYGSFA